MVVRREGKRTKERSRKTYIDDIEERARKYETEVTKLRKIVSIKRDWKGGKDE